jgi:hypothetical protein
MIRHLALFLSLGLAAPASGGIELGHPRLQRKGPELPGAEDGSLIRAQGTAPVCVNGGSPVTCAVDMQYFGGHVLSNAKLYAVFWTSAIDPEIQSGIGGFYAALVDSEWMDWLAEYSTTRTTQAGSRSGQPGSQQLIGRGTFAGSYTLTEFSRSFPSCAAPDQALTCITDSDISTELDWQVAQGHLPPPDADTLYVVHFPPSVRISDPGGVSCRDFCAYHGAYRNAAQQSVFYAVLPDLSQSGCQTGCGSGSAFQRTCAAASHEVAEVITDGESGLANGEDYPLAWYDTEPNSQGEIGDMCKGHQDTLGSDGLTGCSSGAAGCYTIQQVFSQVVWSSSPASQPDSPACVSSRFDADDYSVAVKPNTLALGLGATSAPIPVLTSLTSGSALQLTLSTGDVPAGLHASFDVASVTAGGTAHLTISADPDAGPLKDGVLVVVASGATTHSAALLVQVDTSPTVSIASPMAGATVSGMTPVSVMATAGVSTSIATISISVDGEPPFSTGTASSTTWNTRSVSNGSHTLEVVVVDADGGRAAASVGVTVSNQPLAGVAGGCSCTTTGDPSDAALLVVSWLALRLAGRSRSSRRTRSAHAPS